MRLSGQAASIPMGYSFFSSVRACERALLFVTVSCLLPAPAAVLSQHPDSKGHRVSVYIRYMSQAERESGISQRCASLEPPAQHVKNMRHREQKCISLHSHNNRFRFDCLTKTHNTTNVCECMFVCVVWK